MRSAGRLKLGYYPLPREEGRRLRRLLHSTEPFNAIDPCVGTGEALHLVTRDLDCRRYGVELDAERAATAQSTGITTVQGNVFDAHAKVETFSLLYLNPPYDSEIGSLGNKRMEFLFLEQTYRWLVIGGVLVFVVPENRLSVCIPLLAGNFTSFRLFRLDDPESRRFNQVVLTAVRKPLRGHQMEANRSLLQRLVFNQPYQNLDDEQEPYLIPPSSPAAIAYRGLPLDQIESEIIHSPAWKQVAPYLLPKEEMATGRPITPLHGGHVGLPAQALAITGLAKYLITGRAARIVAECGAGKTFMSLGTIHVHAGGRPYTSLVMCPPHIVHKWAREALLTVPGARAFIIEDLRNGGDPKNTHGIVEVKLEKGKTVVRGLTTTLPKLRSMGRAGWRALCPGPAFFIMGKEKGKLGYFWKHAFSVARSGRDLGGLINPDTGHAVPSQEGGFLTRPDLREAKFHETYTAGRSGKTRFSPLWQADGGKIQRMAPLDFIGRYMKDWWDYAVADELHQLAGDTAQGNGLGVLARCAKKLIALTGTLMGGYADDLFNIFYRMEPRRMVAAGYEAGSQGRRDFQEQYGVLETVEKVRETDNACSKAQKRTVQVLRKPGASPLLFGKYLMESTAFITLEDISDQLPSYEESVLTVDMDPDLAKAYEAISEDITSAMKEHRGNKSLMSVMLNTLLLYPDHPFDIEEIWGKRYDQKEGCMVPFFVTKPPSLPETDTYAKERRLIEDIRDELRQGRRCQVYATFTGKHDVTGRLAEVLQKAGFRVAVLRSTVPTDKREAWYEKQLKEGVEVVICHPRLVETGLDLLAFPTLYFYETGYSLHTLRQASRRSWRIGQHLPVRVKFLAYSGTMQETCIRHMGKKMLVALMMEGKFSGEGLQSLDANEDLLTAMARELVEKGGVGETADAVWKDLERERAKHVPAPTPAAEVIVLPVAPVEEQAGIESRPEPLPVPVLAGPQLVYPTKPRPKRKSAPLWPTGHTLGEQMRLFG